MALFKQHTQAIYKRQYEKDLAQLKMPAHYYGYTNRILVQSAAFSEDVNYYIPVYLILKIKSLQDIDIQKLTGNISCVIIINILIQKLPQPLIHLLQNSIEMQLNRSEVIILKEDIEKNITMKKNQKMLTFTIRKNVSASIVQDTLWSPFQIIRLIVSITFNSISKREGFVILKNYKEKMKKCEDQERIDLIRTVMKESVGNDLKRQVSEIPFNEYKRYSFSFNCMRNGAEIPINYALGCVYSLYDLAERKLEAYHTNYDSYSEVIRNFKEGREKNRKKDKPEQQQLTSRQEWPLPLPEGQEVEVIQTQNSSLLSTVGSEIYDFMQLKSQKKDNKAKAKYFQYTHFVIPLYKYPGNSLATIFIPLFLLALLSLGIFFQENDLSNRISSIATMVLGYIALIPSIKEQLPPSSRITIIEIVIYISTLCCLFSLLQSFLIDEDPNYVFNWRTNSLFLLCLFTYIGVFVFIVVLMLLHKCKWEPSYNINVEARKTDPQKNPHEWVNPYCDEQFYKTNAKIYSANKTVKDENKKQSMIVRYDPKFNVKENEPQSQKKKNESLPSPIEVKIQKSPKKTPQGDPSLNESILFSPKKKEEGETKEKGTTEKKQKKRQRKLLQYQKNLKFVDDLIEKGGHVTWKEKKEDDSKLKKGYERVKKE